MAILETLMIVYKVIFLRYLLYFLPLGSIGLLRDFYVVADIAVI